MVAVDTRDSVAMASGVRGMDWFSIAFERRILRGKTFASRAVNAWLSRDKCHLLRENGDMAVHSSNSSDVVAAFLVQPRLLPSGDSAITVEFSRNIDDEANRRVLALDQTLASEAITGITETVPTYRSLLVHYDPIQIGFDALGEKLTTLAQLPVPPTTSMRRWRIPVAYGSEHGIDLEDVARALATTPDDIVARHTAGDYRVAMIGFTPGWSYLSGLEDSLQMPRRQNPRLLTPAGTISIGGVQTGVQCLAGPSGWHLLGRTAVRTYQLHRQPTFLLEPGDSVTFSAVDAQTFAEQDRAAEAGEIVAELIAS
jgi:KipI family sensor histidine kinase inhibitor